MTAPHVLAADDDVSLLGMMVRELTRMGLNVDRAENGHSALVQIKRARYDLIVTDLYMPGATGLDLLQAAKERDPQVQVIVMTGDASLDTAIEALNKGAFGYLTKPFDDLSVFSNTVSRALELRRLTLDNIRLVEIQRRRGDLLQDEVSERIQQLRRRQQEVLDLLACLPDGVLVIDAEGRIVLSNQAAEQLLAQETDAADQPIWRWVQALREPSDKPREQRVQAHGRTLRLIVIDLARENERKRTVVIIQDIGEVEAAIRRKMAGPLANLKQGLAWLSRQPLKEKEVELVKILAVQLAVLERLGPASAGANGRPQQPLEEGPGKGRSSGSQSAPPGGGQQR